MRMLIHSERCMLCSAGKEGQQGRAFIRGITAGTQHLLAVQEACAALSRAQHVVDIAHDISRGFATPRVQLPQAGQVGQQAVHISMCDKQCRVVGDIQVGERWAGKVRWKAQQPVA